MGNVLTDTIMPGVNYDQLNKIVASAFEEPGPDKLRRTRSIVIVYDGQIIVEKYTDGFDENSKLTGWSMSKSITNALIGILVKKGTLDINQPAPVDSWEDDERKNITLNNLLHASSGLKWVEQYGGPSDATNMLFKEKDMGLFAAEHQIEFNPEEKFVYSSGTSNLLSWIIRKSVGEDDYYRFPYEQLFYKIGMQQTTMEPDAGGTFVCSSYTFGTARDWARFGLLYLNDGWFNGEQILPEGWVKYTRTPAPAAPLAEYGAQFWLNAGAKDNPSHRIFPDVPTDLYWADGFEGQNVFVLPSKKLVVVKLSLSQGDYLDDNKFIAGIIDALP
jgi:CubicO group peptidase (beta-lactamase class C family)